MWFLEFIRLVITAKPVSTDTRERTEKRLIKSLDRIVKWLSSIETAYLQSTDSHTLTKYKIDALRRDIALSRKRLRKLYY
jgi:hypothetical protein